MKENIIMIVADQWRSDSLRINGNEACVTPNLDQLAKDGVNFSQAFCQNPVCVPSRCSFLSGMYPHTHGHRTMHFLMNSDEPNLLKTMKNNDYHVYWGGRNDFLHESVNQMDYCDIRDDVTKKFMDGLKTGVVADDLVEMMKGFKHQEEKWRSKENYYYAHYRGINEKNQMGMIDREIIDGGINYIKTNGTSEKPFFMYLTGMLPHPPYGTTHKFYEQINMSKVLSPERLSKSELFRKPAMLRGIWENQKLSGLSDHELKTLKAIYYAMGTELDTYIGNLIEVLKEKNLYDSTTIIFFSDHGDYTGDYEIVEKSQNTFEDYLTNVPLIIKPAKHHIIKKRTTSALVELIDVQATIFDLCKIEPNYTHFGKSLLPVLKGNENHRQYVHTEGGRIDLDGTYAHDAGHQPTNEYWPRTSVQATLPGHTKALMIRNNNYKYVFRLYETDEFYNLKTDPSEKNNIINCLNEDEQKVHDELKNEALFHMVYSSDLIPHRYDNR